MADSRRDFLKKSAAAGGLVWAAPVITRMSPAAAATPPVCDCAGTNAFDVAVTVDPAIGSTITIGPIRQAPPDSGCLAVAEVDGIVSVNATADCVNADTDGTDGTCGSDVSIANLVIAATGVISVTADELTASAACTCPSGCATETCVTNLDVILLGTSLTGGPVTICDPGTVFNVGLNVLGTTVTGTVAVARVTEVPCTATALEITLTIDPPLLAATTVTVVVARATAECA